MLLAKETIEAKALRSESRQGAYIREMNIMQIHTTLNVPTGGIANKSTRLQTLRGGFSITACAVLLLLPLERKVEAATLEKVATGLNNPRGLNFGPEGALYIAEAGRGGAGPCGPGPEGPRCYGTSGSITRLDLRRGTQERVSTGLPSLASDDGSFATGPHDISFQGRGNAYVTIGFGGNPMERQTNFGAAGAQFGRMLRVSPNGKWKVAIDLGAYEIKTNPTGDEIDTNPYGVLAASGKQIVADAGANALNALAANGKMSTLAVFTNRLVSAPPFLGLPAGAQIPMDAVPTTVTEGPDGAYYVGQLTGFPFPVDGANVFRVPATGGAPEVFASGFTGIIDIAFGNDGSLYVLEIARNGLLAGFNGGDWGGALIRIAPDGTRTEIASEGLIAPGGIAIGRDGAIYITNNSIYSGTGEVVKIIP